MSKTPTVQTEDKYVLRLPDGMRDRLKAVAEKNNRSMNAEIISRLENSEEVLKFLADFQILKERTLRQDQHIADLNRSLERTGTTAKTAQEISRQLIDLLLTRLGANENEIIAITRPGKE